MEGTARLPGIYFETAPRELDEVLPRMDVAAFVGFAERGPLDTPVPVEDPVRFREIFGADLPLARDPERGTRDFAYLAPAVEAFFRDGGRRCWVVRVAARGGAAPELVELPVPGLVRAADLALAADSDDAAPPWVSVHGRSRGSWARALAVGAVLRPEAVRLDAGARSDPGLPFDPEGGYRLDLAAAAGQVVPGDLLEVVRGGLSLLVFAEAVTPRAAGLRVRAASGWWLERPPGVGPDGALDAVPIEAAEARARLGASPPSPAATALPVVRRLTFELLVWRGLHLEARLAGLAFHPDHPRFWAALPSDEEIFHLPHGRLEPMPDPARAVLLGQVDTPRFPVAGPAGGAAGPCLPFHMADRPDPTRLGRAAPEPADRLAAEGLATFGAHLFVDPDLAPVHLGTLLGEAEHALYLDPGADRDRRSRLVGLHCLLPIEEATLVAAPDATHRHWFPEEPPAEPAPEPEPPGSEPDAADFHACPGVEPTETDGEADGPPDPGGPADARPPDAVLEGVREFAADDLLAVQRALVRFAAARADLVAVLSLPRHYRSEEALAHLDALDPGIPTVGRGSDVPPLTAGEAPALGFGALYHPWIATVGEAGRGAGAVFTPPEGAVCGVAARRAREDGAWVAAANRPLSGVVALDPPFQGDEAATLALTRLNLVQERPRGYLVLDNDTLSADAERRPFNVRRLLILLRRLALREGNTQVFEPNDAAFRRSVRSRFERLLSDLFVRGAFAGDRPEAGFRVIADDAVNPPASVELGRFVVELQVAPSRPLAFLTVRLVLSGPERLAVLES